MGRGWDPIGGFPWVNRAQGFQAGHGFQGCPQAIESPSRDRWLDPDAWPLQDPLDGRLATAGRGSPQRGDKPLGLDIAVVGAGCRRDPDVRICGG